jgi:hypothetical protein
MQSYTRIHIYVHSRPLATSQLHMSLHNHYTPVHAAHHPQTDKTHVLLRRKRVRTGEVITSARLSEPHGLSVEQDQGDRIELYKLLLPF